MEAFDFLAGDRAREKLRGGRDATGEVRLMLGGLGAHHENPVCWPESSRDRAALHHCAFRPLPLGCAVNSTEIPCAAGLR